jgi:predicted RNA-binding protein with PIN domain
MRRVEMIVVFDGWQGGWTTEKKERIKGIEIVFSKLGEKADDVIKRLVREKGSGAMVVTSDRDVSRFVERRSVPVIPSDQFQRKMEGVPPPMDRGLKEEEEDEKKEKGKGPSRRLSKKAKRAKAAFKKL